MLASWAAEGTVSVGAVTSGTKGIELKLSTNVLMTEFAFSTSDVMPEVMVASVLFRKSVI